MSLRTSKLNKNPLQCRLSVSALEDRLAPSVSTIVSNFNGTSIPAGDTVWFSSVAKVSGLESGTEVLSVTDGTVSFTANGNPYTVNLPPMAITFTTLATSASTSYDANGWHVTTPPVNSGNLFLGGVALSVPDGLPGGIKNVTWSANFTSDTPGLSVSWQWAAAVYTQFGSSPSTYGVKTVDNGSLDSVYHNSDHAGTPEAFKQNVVGGARGGGGSNYTGSYSGTAKVTTDATPPATDSSASISGSVFLVDNGNSQPVSGITIVLLDANGNVVLDGNGNSMITSTDSLGAFSFNSLPAGSYTVHESLAADSQYTATHSEVGTVDGNSDGTNSTATSITGVTLVGGNVGINYNFYLGLGDQG